MHKLERERREISGGIDHLKGSTHKWRRMKIPSKG
jgi:hypothetical protein